jgi:chemotaxis protein methyltransferase CheR
VELARLNQQQFDQFSHFIYSKCGIRIDGKKVALLSNRVRRRLQAGGFEDFDVYYRFLTSPGGAAELEHFLDAITTNETFFFRTAKQFTWLKTELLTEWVAQQRAGHRPASLRIWSAGCASGAEPYSIAICLAESRYRVRDWSLQVVGTDISEAALRVARAGRFKERAVEAVSDMQRRRYFRHQAEGDLWQVRAEIKNLVEFKRHNLMEPLFEPEFDCIFLRNVLIYFDHDSKQVVLRNVRRALAAGGYLVVGPSEGVFDMLDPLQRISPLVYRKAGPARERDGIGTIRDGRQ